MLDIPRLFLMFFNFINGISGFIVTLTLFIFIWGLFRLVFYSRDSKDREQAKGYIVWGLIALTVMISVWGLVNLLRSTFHFGNERPMMPEFPNPQVF